MMISTPSLAKLLLLAKEPLCNTMYVWGGGWNEADTGAGLEARSLDVSPAWASFASKQPRRMVRLILFLHICQSSKEASTLS